jgi:hypothetical protein
MGVQPEYRMAKLRDVAVSLRQKARPASAVILDALAGLSLDELWQFKGVGNAYGMPLQRVAQATRRTAWEIDNVLQRFFEMISTITRGSTLSSSDHSRAAGRSNRR